MRGTQYQSIALQGWPGIIPAHAGNTPGYRIWVYPPKDHPRACGEHHVPILCAEFPRGSSPRMRGTRYVARFPSSWLGIIPAHAGNTLSARSLIRYTGDHPRACGEHDGHGGGSPALPGSSPRMRGTRFRPDGQHVVAGIIPAHAGNTGVPGWPCAAYRDHPRACGEHPTKPLISSTVLGSSPRMRGTLGFRDYEGYQRGIIPAHAGNTSAFLYAVSSSWDHPRACGEHINTVVTDGTNSGSSPRMRGTQFLSLSVILLIGIIPAHAGNTLRN